MKVNEIILNLLLGISSFLAVYCFKEVNGNLKQIQVQLTSIQIQLKELEVKQESFVTETRVIELIKEYTKK